ncbi:hypothetical protein COB18_01145 [Candidatus Kaiserbacteria bacterium]|nr:MAG: hypothetical protein COB18_01145 [Candidatus Kaiserbacteria bacterium]
MHFVLAVLILSISPLLLEAATFQNPLALKVITDMLKGLVMSVIYVGTPALVVAIMWTGFLFTSAGGNADKLTKAKSIAIKVLIGGVLLLSLWAIVELVSSTLAGFGAATLLIVLAAFYLYARFKS